MSGLARLGRRAMPTLPRCWGVSGNPRIHGTRQSAYPFRTGKVFVAGDGIECFSVNAVMQAKALSRKLGTEAPSRLADGRPVERRFRCQAESS